MKNVLLKFWVQQDMLNNRAQSEHIFTCSANSKQAIPNTEAHYN